jgi:hypothetical protein
VLSLLAAVAAALTPILGKEILSLGAEAKWIRARATAEAIKSECFRFAAGAGDYPGADAQEKFAEHLSQLSEEARKAQLFALQDPVPASGDRRRPSLPLDPKWYMASRNVIDEFPLTGKKTQILTARHCVADEKHGCIIRCHQCRRLQEVMGAPFR